MMVPTIPPLEGEGPEQREGGGVVRTSLRMRRGRSLGISAPPLPGSLTRSDPPPQGEGWARAPESLVRTARDLRKTMTPQEVKLWVRLRELKAQGLRFRRQVPLKGYVCDFLCHASKAVVGVDGMQHGFELQSQRDKVRDRILAEAGLLTLRFTNDDVHSNLEGIVQTIWEAAKKRLASTP
jgi:very-short-patch-repair endonuclease